MTYASISKQLEAIWHTIISIIGCEDLRPHGWLGLTVVITIVHGIFFASKFHAQIGNSISAATERSQLRDVTQILSVY